MMVEKKSTVEINLDDQSSSELFPYPFVFRTRSELSEHISQKFDHDRILYYPKLVSGLSTLILPLFNVFTIYRNVIHQREDFADAYSIFHSIVFYGEFLQLHLFIWIFFIVFTFRNLKSGKTFCPSKGRWIYFFDVLFTLMTFGMLKLVPIFSTHGINFLYTQMNFIIPVIRKLSKSLQPIAFIILILLMFIEFLFLFGLLILIILVKVYQLSFVGEVESPSQWSINQWFLFIGFCGNIINLSDIPTISQASFMWDISNQNWSEDSNTWSQDKFAETRKIHLFTEICQTLGFIKGFLWLRSMSASDLHSLVRSPSSTEHSSDHVQYIVL